MDCLMWTEVSRAVPPALQRRTNPSGCKPQDFFPSVYSLQLRRDSADETDLTDPGLTHSATTGEATSRGANENLKTELSAANKTHTLLGSALADPGYEPTKPQIPGLFTFSGLHTSLSCRPTQITLDALSPTDHWIPQHYIRNVVPFVRKTTQ
ncbi:unnamed protein product [Leuciscus chuanchicus]